MSVVESRFMTNNLTTVNGLTTSLFSLDETGFATYEKYYGLGPYIICYAWIRVFIRHQDQTETEITSGLSAQISDNVNGDQVISATWTCPQTQLASTDALLIRAYGRVYQETPTPWYFDGQYDDVEGYTTITIMAPNGLWLDAATWTINYYVYRWSNPFPWPGTTWQLWDFWIDNITWMQPQQPSGGGGPIFWFMKVSWTGMLKGIVKRPESTSINLKGILLHKLRIGNKIKGSLLHNINAKFLLAAACSKPVSSTISLNGILLHRISKSAEACGSCLQGVSEKRMLQGRNYSLITWELLNEND
jgi:hypothetical protein